MFFRKIVYILGLIFVMSLNFFCIEYVMFTLYEDNNFILFIFLLFLFTILQLIIVCLDKLNFYSKLINRLIVYLSMFMGFGILILLSKRIYVIA